jgi:hypothetical protein
MVLGQGNFEPINQQLHVLIVPLQGGCVHREGHPVLLSDKGQG